MTTECEIRKGYEDKMTAVAKAEFEKLAGRTARIAEEAVLQAAAALDVRDIAEPDYDAAIHEGNVEKALRILSTMDAVLKRGELMLREHGATSEEIEKYREGIERDYIRAHDEFLRKLSGDLNFKWFRDTMTALMQPILDNATAH